jgi:hypothetical protein
MGTDAKLYTPTKIDFFEFVNLVKQVLDVEIHSETYHNGLEYEGDYPYGNVVFNYKNEWRTLWYFSKSQDFDPNVPHIQLNFGMWGYSTEILTKLGEHLSGWLDEDDCDDEPNVWIEQKNQLVKIEPTNYQNLVRYFASQMRYEDAVKLIGVLQEHKEKILKFNFGFARFRARIEER